VVEVSFVADLLDDIPTRVISYGLLAQVTAAAHNTGQPAARDCLAASTTTGDFPQ
jgi:hypothetical protein